MNAKLILVVVRGGGCDRLAQRLLDAQYQVTEFSSMGGFFRRRNTTLLIILPAEEVERALDIIRKICPTPPDADEHNATIFVMDARRFVTI